MATNQTKKPHHHGDLRTALVEAGIELLSQGGLAALTLRQCAARAGVSHAAPAHHFDGLKGLLTAIVTRGFKAFTQAMVEPRDAAGSSPHARLIAVCNGYLAFAENNDAMAALMFMTGAIFTDDPEYQSASATAYQVLAGVCAPFKSGTAGPKGTELLIWSLVQGYSSLARSGQIDTAVTPFADILPQLNLQTA